MIRTPLFPTYSRSRALIRFLNDKESDLFSRMWTAIWELRGTPQENVNWKNPEIWIPERLADKSQEMDFALDIWRSTSGLVNPRYVRGIQFLMNNHNLIETSDGLFKITPRGSEFCANDENSTVREIDHDEGCDYVLYLSSIKKNSSVKAFHDDWADYSVKYSNNRKESVFKDSLRRRLLNLIDRNLVFRDGIRYNITPKGQEYLRGFSKQLTAAVSEEQKLHNDVELFNSKQKAKLKEFLHSLPPTQFEYLVKDLLDGMGFEDVEVTSPTNDKGVDVVAKMQNGISTITEVVQVKRHTNNIQRKVLDQLRGSLHRFNALQGTIITLSDFARGAKDAAFERGAAPITLINGDKLIELLVENDITVKKRQLIYFTIEEDYFTTEQEDEE